MRVYQSIAYSFSIIFFVMGQYTIWFTLDNTVPYLLTSIFWILTAIYLQGYGK